MLISRFRKQGLLSQFSILEFSKLFILVVLTCFIVLISIFNSQIKSNYSTVMTATQTSVREYIWIHSLAMVIKIKN